ncbi:hypothetical protein BDZ91DRAFT_847048 [Kalaharituber pfeilii]|nr:hypothetical protein BDZ91DRAFT_847048 [Kalaharituber pfeilii]
MPVSIPAVHAHPSTDGLLEPDGGTSLRQRKSYRRIPTEILLQIFHYAIGSPGCRIKWQYASTPHYRFHYPYTDSIPSEIAQSRCTLCPLQNLYNWALVSRQWNAIITPYLYSELDLHMLAIPAHAVHRPVLLRRDIWPYGTEKEVSYSATCLLAEPTGNGKLGQTIPVPKYGNHAKLVTRRLRDQDKKRLGLNELARRHRLNRMVPTPDQQFVLDFEYAPAEFEHDAEPDVIRYKTKKMLIYAPIRAPSDCCFPSHHHHNFTPEWWDLLGCWNDPTEHNPITEYTLNRVMLPLIRTLTARPDLADLVTKIQLPLVVYQDYVLHQDESLNQLKPPLAGRNITRPEEQRLRLFREAPLARTPIVLIHLLQATLRLTELCRNLEVLDGYWSLDILSLHLLEHQRQVLKSVQCISQEVLNPEPAAESGDPSSSGPPLGRTIKKQSSMTRITNFARTLRHKLSNKKLKANDDSHISPGDSNADASTDLKIPNAHVEDSDMMAVPLPGDGLISSGGSSLHSELGNDKPNDAHTANPSSLWRELLRWSVPRLKYLRLDFASPMSMALADCRWASHCGSEPRLKMCRRKHWQNYASTDLRSTMRDQLSNDDSLDSIWDTVGFGFPAKQIELSLQNNLVHLEFATIEEDEIHNARNLSQVKARLSQAFSYGLENLRSLSLMDSYVSLLVVVPANKLEALQVSRWHITSHLSLVLQYLERSHNSVANPEATILKSLTLDTVSGKLGTAFWAGEDCYPLLIGGVSSCMVRLPCGGQRQVFNGGYLHEKYFLSLEHVYNIIQYAPNLEELILRRGRPALDEYWKMQMEARYTDWVEQTETLSSSGRYLSPPIAHKLKTLALLVWGEDQRNWLLNAITSLGMFPGLKDVIYTPAVVEHHRRQEFRVWYRHERLANKRQRKDYRFWNWDDLVDAELNGNPSYSLDQDDLKEEAEKADERFTESLRIRGINVTRDHVMGKWDFTLPKYNSVIVEPHSETQRGPIPVDHIETRRLWKWYNDHIEFWWQNTWKANSGYDPDQGLYEQV